MTSKWLNQNFLVDVLILRTYVSLMTNIFVRHSSAEALIDGIVSALKKVDVIVTTGSVSMGDRDMLKPILTKVLKATIHFGKMRLLINYF